MVSFKLCLKSAWRKELLSSFESEIKFEFGQLDEKAGISDKKLQIDVIWGDSDNDTIINRKLVHVVNDLVLGT